jgi:cell division protein FtsN
MPTTDCATDISLPPSPDLASQTGNYSNIDAAEPAYEDTSRLLRGLLFGFAATVTIALALASCYVGVRIVAANQEVAAKQTAPPSAPVIAMPAPPPVELYLQVAGLGPKQDAEFMNSLQSNGFNAQIQNQDSDNARILIGPFSTHAEMEQKQRKLQSGGILAVEMAVQAGN